jgi:hypothetical protein
MTGTEQECLHPRQEIRWRKDSIGRVVVLGQCLDCGCATTQFLKKDLLPEGANEWDASWDAKRDEAFALELVSLCGHCHARIHGTEAPHA